MTKHTTKYISKKLITIVLISIFSASSICQAKSTDSLKASQNNLDKIVAIVNDDVITYTELDKNIRKLKTQYKQSGQMLPSDVDLKKHVLNTMILDELQLQMAKMNNITATPEQINESLDNIAKQNKINIFDLKKLIEKDGISFEEFKKELVDKLTIMNVQRAAVSNNVNISEQELTQTVDLMDNQNAKNQYRLSHILISVPNEPNSEKIKFAKKRAEEIVKELSNGKDFVTTAKIVSDGQKALDGGDLGWFSISELPSIFADITPKLKKNQIYGPIQSENGFHIIKLADVKYDEKKFQEDSYKISHILIKKDDFTNDVIAKKELNKLKQEIEKNNNFAEIALIYSEDYGSASNGGELGWVNLNTLVPEFSEVIKTLKPNQISKPFETRFGWHIAKLEDKKLVDNTDKLKKNQAYRVLQEKKFEDALAKWQNKIRSEAHVKVLI